jgi:hypothetical protein
MSISLGETIENELTNAIIHLTKTKGIMVSTENEIDFIELCKIIDQIKTVRSKYTQYVKTKN